MTRIGVAEARKRFREVLDRVADGETIEIARRDEVVAVVSPPARPAGGSFGDFVRAWRGDRGVDDWPDDEPFADVRDPSPGRGAPW